MLSNALPVQCFLVQRERNVSPLFQDRIPGILRILETSWTEKAWWTEAASLASVLATLGVCRKS